jgi:hypothetical protein
MWILRLNNCMIMSFYGKQRDGFRLNFQFWPNASNGNSMMEVPSAHPQHMNDAITLYMHKVDVGGIPSGYGASTAV